MKRGGAATILTVYAAGCLAAWALLLWRGPWYAAWPAHLPLAVAVLAGLCADAVLGGQRARSGWTAGLWLMVIGGLAIGLGAGRATGANAGYPEAESAWRAAGAVLQERAAFFAARGVAPQSQVFLANVLWGLTLLSGLLFFCLIVLKPGEPAVGPRQPWEPRR